MIRRLVRALIAYCRRVNHRPVGMRPTRAQRVTRVAVAADVREQVGFVDFDIEEWTREMGWADA